MSINGQFFETTNETSTYISREIAPNTPAYSIGVIIEGTFNIDIKLQTSMDGENFVDVTGSETSGLSDSLEVVQFDVNLGRHRFSRVVITHNSGTFDAKGFVR